MIFRTLFSLVFVSVFGFATFAPEVVSAQEQQYPPGQPAEWPDSFYAEATWVLQAPCELDAEQAASATCRAAALHVTDEQLRAHSMHWYEHEVNVELARHFVGQLLESPDLQAAIASFNEATDADLYLANSVRILSWKVEFPVTFNTETELYIKFFAEDANALGRFN